jgi:hypothetical protein
MTEATEMTRATIQKMMIDSADGHIRVRKHKYFFSLRGLKIECSPDMRATCGKLWSLFLA